MPEQRTSPLIGLDGKLGWVNPDEQPSSGQEAIVHLENGTRIRIPADLLTQQPDGTYTVPLSSEQFRSVSLHTEGNRETVLVIPVVAEEVRISKQSVTKGRVQITKQVREREEVIDVPILREEVQVNRVPVDRFVDSPPEVRYEGDMMIIPVLEEVLVVERRLRVKEEIQITRVQKQVHEQKQVTLREEVVDVNRVEDNQNK